VLVLCLCGILSFLDFSLWMFSLYAPWGTKIGLINYLIYLILYYPAIYLHKFSWRPCMYVFIYIQYTSLLIRGGNHVKLNFGTTFGKNTTVNQMNTDASQYFLLRSTNSYMFPETISNRYRFLIKARQNMSSPHVRTRQQRRRSSFWVSTVLWILSLICTTTLTGPKFKLFTLIILFKLL
jgi:hypothetical protein